MPYKANQPICRAGSRTITLTKKTTGYNRKIRIPLESQAQVPGFWDSIEVSNAEAVALWSGINDWAEANSIGSLQI
jgi:hypothetical protein